MADGLAVGANAPDVMAPLVAPDGTVETRSLSSLVADQPVLLAFYTMDFSPDCVKEWCDFRDFDWFASGTQVQVIGVSKSGVRIHRRFIDRLGLNFPLFADSDLDVARAFDVDYRAFRLFERARRSCFLVDSEMTVRYRWLAEHWLDPTRETPPVSEIHEAIQAELGEPGESFGFA